jgi:hypothetical protein
MQCKCHAAFTYAPARTFRPYHWPVHGDWHAGAYITIFTPCLTSTSLSLRKSNPGPHTQTQHTQAYTRSSTHTHTHSHTHTHTHTHTCVRAGPTTGPCMGASMHVIMLSPEGEGTDDALPLGLRSSGKPMTLRSHEKSVREPAVLCVCV